ncbi:MAG: response regulator [Deltaproteobacteria bacterium]|nr:response regulator [Deltaproteobacteria bacterium]
MKKVAIVEDNPDNRLLVEAILEDEFELELFEDGIEAVAGIPQFEPHVILLDISLPGMDGKEVLRRLRAEPRTSSIPVIAFTAHAMYGDREDLLALGFNDYVSKPIVDEDVLIDAIQKLMPSSD